MTDHEINVAIAETLPGLCYKAADGNYYWGKSIMGDGREIISQGKRVSFTHDLNVMYEVEEWVSNWDLYRKELAIAVGGAGTLANMIHAKARQRAKAFLCMIGKWKE